MPPKTSTGTAVGIGSVGAGVALTGLVKWCVVLMGLPVMPEDAALGLATILTIAGLGIAKMFNVVVERIGRRDSWTPEQRARMVGNSANPSTGGQSVN